MLLASWLWIQCEPLLAALTAGTSPRDGLCPWTVAKISHFTFKWPFIKVLYHSKGKKKLRQLPLVHLSLSFPTPYSSQAFLTSTLSCMRSTLLRLVLEDCFSLNEMSRKHQLLHLVILSAPALPTCCCHCNATLPTSLSFSPPPVTVLHWYCNIWTLT